MPADAFTYRCATNRLFIAVFAVAMSLMANDDVSARVSTPRLNLILPRGVQRGNEHTLRFSGERLDQTEEVFFYDTGIDAIAIQQVDSRNVDITVVVKDDCRLGEHCAQLRTRQGISDFRTFYVGSMAELSEVEPNNSASQSQYVDFNRTINGTITNEDVDVFQIECQQGQRLSIEIQAMRLAELFDPFISVIDNRGFELAVSDDTSFSKQDGFISLIVPSDGKYYVTVRESSFGGNEKSRYRLHVGSFPRPSVAYPAGGQPDSQQTIQFIGDANGTMLQKIQTQPGREGRSPRDTIFLTDDQGTTPTPLAFQHSSLINQFEVEPNDKREQVQKIHDLPAAFNGIISTPDDHDHFKFIAEKGQTFEIDVLARRIGSGLDPVIHIFNATGKRLAGDDDSKRPDCFLRFTAPDSGEYSMRIKDHLNRGQSDFVYRIKIETPQPSLTFSIPRSDRYSQIRQQIVVAKGNRFATLISSQRRNFGGPLKLVNGTWPEGVSMTSPIMPANLNEMPVVFSAAEDAPVGGTLVDLRGKHADDSKNISGGFRLRADFARGNPNNSVYHSATVDRLACAVTERLPFRVDLVPPTAPLVRDGRLKLKIVVHRDEGFDSDVIVQFPFRPPGLGTKHQVRIKKGKSEGFYPLNANGSAQLGTWPVFVTAQGDVNGPVWVSSDLVDLQIAEPYVTAEIPRTAVEQGQTGTVFCTLNHLQPFEGTATAQLLGIPRDIVIPPLEFNSQTKELQFEFKTTETSKIGKHKGLFCRMLIPHNGDQIVSTAGRSELQINPPAKKSNVNKSNEAKVKPVGPSATPKKKPKSRLQQLREAAKANQRN